MLGFLGHHPRFALRRRLTTLAALAAYLATAFGVPLPVPTGKDLSRPFPCQNHLCGCRSADECLRRCCCFSDSERRAWAIRNDVELPRPQGWRSARLRDQEQDGATPARPTAKTCCADARQTAARAADAPCPSCRPQKPESPKEQGWRLELVTPQCQPLPTLWVSVGAATPPPPALTWSPLFPPRDWLSSANSADHSLATAPPDPPPRSARA